MQDVRLGVAFLLAPVKLAAGERLGVSRIGQRGAMKESDVYMRSEYVDVAEGRIAQACHRTPVVQQLQDFVAAVSHHLKPLLRDGPQFSSMLFHPSIDGRIPLASAVESQYFRSHRLISLKD